MDCRPVQTTSGPGVKFTWEGSDDGNHASGRGIATLQDDASLRGHIYFHSATTQSSGPSVRELRSATER
jgi:hypothetical protein